MSYSVRNIVIAVVTAVAAAVVVLLYTSSFKEQVTRDQERVQVLVAKVEIPEGTAAEKATGSMELREVVASDRAPGALTSAESIRGTVATQAVFAGQQVVTDVFQPSITQGASLQLRKTERGVRVVVDTAKGVIGAIKPGDSVDVFGTFEIKAATGGTAVVTRLLLSDVRVLEAPEPDGDAKLEVDTEQIVMLGVTQREAAKLAFMAADDTDRTMQFVVRPPKGQAAEMPTPIETVESMIMEGLTVAEIKKRLPQLRGASATSGPDAAPDGDADGAADPDSSTTSEG